MARQTPPQPPAENTIIRRNPNDAYPALLCGISLLIIGTVFALDTSYLLAFVSAVFALLLILFWYGWRKGW